MPYPKGKKQSPEAALKRKQTMLERYGVSNCASLPNHGQKIKGIKRKARTPEHTQKIIESKRKNGTLNHSEKAKEKIRKSVAKVYASDNPPITISENNNINHEHGYIHGIYYRSSYEKRFIEYCLTNNIKIETAETKEFRVPYEYEGKRHFYYPDFYLPEYDMIVEIKPTMMLTNDIVQSKLIAMSTINNFSVVCEEELDNLDEYFRYLK